MDQTGWNSSACFQCPLMVLYWNVTGATNASQICTGCEPGWFLNQTSCQSCQPGSYSVNLSQTACTLCPPGAFSVIPGAASAGVCQACPLGTYQDTPGSTACVPCPPGTFGPSLGADSSARCLACPDDTANPSQGATNSTACLPCQVGYASNLVNCSACPPGTFFVNGTCSPCPPGAYSSAPGQTACSLCPAGTAQALPGSPSCEECSGDEFSSDGDANCSQCGLNEAPLGQACQTPGWPDGSNATWLAVSGVEATDLCIGQGLPWIGSGTLSQPVFTYASQATCQTTLYLQGHPELTQRWTTAVPGYQRPVGVLVYRHNQTFYQDLCAAKGLSLAFTLQDARGETQVDTSDMQAVLTLIRADDESTPYGSTICNTLPSQRDAVPFGYCFTSVCPGVEVIAQVTVSWPTGSVVGHSLLYSAGSPGFVEPPGWLLDFELASPGIPYFPGDTVTVYVTSPNAPWTVDSFQFAADVGPYAVLRGYSSDFQVSGGQQGSVLSILGVNGPPGLNASLVTLTFTILQAGQGVQALFTVRANTQVVITTSYQPLVGSRNCRGYSLDKAGSLWVLLDQVHVTQILARPSRLYLTRIQALYSLSVAANAM